MTTVCLIDDHTVVRQAIARLLEDEADLDVWGQASTIEEAHALLGTADLPDVVVADVSLPDGNGLALIRELRARNSDLGLVVLTMHSDDATLLAALDAGASVLVLKSAPSADVVRAVHQAAAAPLSFAADGLADAIRRRSSGPTLTARENEVLQLLVGGAAVSAVAKQLYMSESTVKTHISRIYDKLGAHNRAGAVMAAVRLGLVADHGP